MIVAAGTTDRQTEQRPADRVDDVGEVEILIVGRRAIAVAFANRQEAGGGHTAGVVIRGPRSGQDIAGDLFSNELIEWLIGIDRSDHPVAILAGLGYRIIRAIARRVGIACDIQPMPAPADSVVG